MILAALAAATYVAVIVYSATREAALAGVVAILGTFGGLLLLFVLVRRTEELLGWALAAAGIGYAIATIAHGTHVDESAPIVGVGLLLCGELTTWSLDERFGIACERGLLRSRALALATLALVSLGASALVLSLAAAPIGGGLAWTILGAGAAVLVVAVAARLARTRPGV
ncbi:MAG: hypothetical protein QOF43_1677 [Gaiellaceae bacterium]|nr:hypothetical protein [Gaiellaceae bacterium]